MSANRTARAISDRPVLKVVRTNKKETGRLLGNEARLVRINLNTVQFDPTYQRPLDHNHINRITADGNWNLHHVRIPTLNRRANGKTFGMDGQHTIHALIKKGFTSFECEVYDGLSPQEEAELFYSRNAGSKAMNGTAKFKAGLAAGRVEETTIHRIITQHGLTIICNGCEIHADFVNTTRVVSAIYRKSGYQHFDRLIGTMALCFRQSRSDRHLQEPAKRTEFIRGFNRFLQLNEGLTPEAICAKLKKSNWNAGNILDDATKLAGECRRIRSIEIKIVEVLSKLFKVPVPDTQKIAA